MNILIGIVGDRSNLSRYSIDSLVYMDLASNSIDTINIRDFFNSNLEIVNIDKEHIVDTLGLSSDNRFIYSNNGYSRQLCLGDKYTEFNFIVPVFKSSNLDKILNYPKYGKFLCIHLVLVGFPDAVLVIDLKTFKLSIEILSYVVYGNKVNLNGEESFGYAVYSEVGEALWKEICTALGIEIRNGVCSVSNICFVDAYRCSKAISFVNDKKLIVHGKIKNKTDIVASPSIEKLDLSMVTNARNNITLYVSCNISLETLVDAFCMFGYNRDKSIGLQCLINDFEKYTGIKIELY